MDGNLLLDDEGTQPDLPWGDEVSTWRTEALPTDAVWGGSTSKGHVREHNEDRFGHRGSIYAVADGMGRRGGGSDAAEATLESVFRRGWVLGDGAPKKRWQAVVRMVNMDVRDRIGELGFPKAGSTLTLVSVEPGRVLVAHVGDSRLYELQEGAFSQRTVDHNLENELANSVMGKEQAKARGLPMTGLTSYIGQTDKHLRVDVTSWSPEPETRLLLCSDGVHRFLDSELIRELLSTLTPCEAARELTKQADAAGGRDNATALVLEL